MKISQCVNWTYDVIIIVVFAIMSRGTIATDIYGIGMVVGPRNHAMSMSESMLLNVVLLL